MVTEQTMATIKFKQVRVIESSPELKKITTSTSTTMDLNLLNSIMMIKQQSFDVVKSNSVVMALATITKRVKDYAFIIIIVTFIIITVSDPMIIAIIATEAVEIKVHSIATTTAATIKWTTTTITTAIKDQIRAGIIKQDRDSYQNLKLAALHTTTMHFNLHFINYPQKVLDLKTSLVKIQERNFSYIMDFVVTCVLGSNS